MNFDGDVTVHAPDLGPRPRAGRVKPGSYRAGFVNLFVHGSDDGASGLLLVRVGSSTGVLGTKSRRAARWVNAQHSRTCSLVRSGNSHAMTNYRYAVYVHLLSTKIIVSLFHGYTICVKIQAPYCYQLQLMYCY